MSDWLVAIALVAVTIGMIAIRDRVLVGAFSQLIREDREAHERQLDDLHDRLTAKSLPEYTALHAKDEKPPARVRARTDAEEAAIERRRQGKT